jgi:hypothetical protein
LGITDQPFAPNCNGCGPTATQASLDVHETPETIGAASDDRYWTICQAPADVDPDADADLIDPGPTITATVPTNTKTALLNIRSRAHVRAILTRRPNPAAKESRMVTGPSPHNEQHGLVP